MPKFKKGKFSRKKDNDMSELDKIFASAKKSRSSSSKRRKGSSSRQHGSQKLGLKKSESAKSFAPNNNITAEEPDSEQLHRLLKSTLDKTRRGISLTSTKTTDFLSKSARRRRKKAAEVASESSSLGTAKRSQTREEVLQAMVPKFVSKRESRKEWNLETSAKELKHLSNELLLPKCGLCGKCMEVQRGDACYVGFASVNCDVCGREDIHGQVWHCGVGHTAAHSGYNMCRTCGYLIPRGRNHDIKRVGPPSDELGLVLSGRQRRRRKTEDGYTIYRHEDVKKVLKIGLGGGTKLCPFECQCCF